MRSVKSSANMAEDTPYSKREQDTFQREVFKRLDIQDSTMSRIESLFTKSDEEVVAIKEWSNATKIIIEKLLSDNSRLKTDRTRIYTIVSVLVVVSGALGLMFYNLIDLKFVAESGKIESSNDKFRTAIETKIDSELPAAISTGIENYFNTHVSKTEIITNQ